MNKGAEHEPTVGTNKPYLFAWYADGMVMIGLRSAAAKGCRSDGERAAALTEITLIVGPNRRARMTPMRANHQTPVTKIFGWLQRHVYGIAFGEPAPRDVHHNEWDERPRMEY